MALPQTLVEPDDCPTLDTGTDSHDASIDLVPTLTIVAHPDLLRLGQKAYLHALKVRRSVLLSRSRLGFRSSDGVESPLRDTSISRSPITFSASRGEGILLEPGALKLQVDGVAIHQAVELTPQRIVKGIQIRLSSGVGLLLHMHSEDQETGASRLIGSSLAIQELRAATARAAAAPAAVLILGESGTGKELVAEAIHSQSSRASGPWVPINMATLNESTAYSHLFGHRKGSFTGAEGAHVGFFERANHGSLFLDEVADTSPRVQAMLLRTLETSRILPMGGKNDQRVDVRVIAATERDVAVETERGSFRGSLAQRLSGILIRVPALRERREDIPSLLLHFLSTLDSSRCEQWLGPAKHHTRAHLSADFMFKLISHRFPGNVRELRNIAAQLLATGHVSARIQRDLAVTSASGRDTRSPEPEQGVPMPRIARRSPTDEALLQALSESEWSPARAARLLGVPNSTVHYWIKQKGVVRRASDYSDSELQTAAQRLGGSVEQLSKALSISERGLRLRLKRARTDC